MQENKNGVQMHLKYKMSESCKDMLKQDREELNLNDSTGSELKTVT